MSPVTEVPLPSAGENEITPFSTGVPLTFTSPLTVADAGPLEHPVSNPAAPIPSTNTNPVRQLMGPPPRYRVGYQSLPSVSPPLGLRAAFQVRKLMLALTPRTLPSPKP